MAVFPVILCGGSGTRLWPSSRGDSPKQFLPLLDGRSTFQSALLRLADVEGVAAPVIVTGAGMLDMVRDQCAAVGADPVILVEPEARDSGPAVAAAAAFVLGRDPDGVVLMLAADHKIDTVAQFGVSANLAVGAARSGAIATFGVHPDAPATGYGYIRGGASIGGGVLKVDAFVEKPDRATAERYLAQGYFWNSGNFAFLASTLMGELAAFAPELGEAAEAAVAQGIWTENVLRLDQGAFGRAPKISLDYAVMERTAKAAVVPAAFQWSDLGAWDAVWEVSQKDAAGNVLQGDGLMIDVDHSLVRTAGPFVGVIGLSDVVVIAERDAVLVAHRSQAQAVKTMVDHLKASGRPLATAHAAPISPGVTRTALGVQDGVSVETWRLAAGAHAMLPTCGVTVTSGEVLCADGETLTLGSQRSFNEPAVLVAVSACGLLVARPL
jgi:mannose-1-phosphate guanylyltransferase